MPASSAKLAQIPESTSAEETYVPIRLAKRLPFKPSIPVAEIRRIVKKVVSERRAATKAATKDAAR